MPALNARREIELHVVAQVVETEFVVRAVSDVGGICGLPLEIIHVVLDNADFQTKEAIDLSHPLCVARSQIIVHRHDVNAAPGQRIQVNRQCGNQRLTFAGAHLGNLALVQHETADHLHIEVPHAGRAFARFTHDRKRLRQDFIQNLLFGGFAMVFVTRVFDGVGDLRFEKGGLLAELLVGKLLDLGLERADLFDNRPDSL